MNLILTLVCGLLQTFVSYQFRAIFQIRLALLLIISRLHRLLGFLKLYLSKTF